MTVKNSEDPCSVNCDLTETSGLQGLGLVTHNEMCLRFAVPESSSLLKGPLSAAFTL